jgi:GH35 family endo-1,4-beta-xylanase
MHFTSSAVTALTALSGIASANPVSYVELSLSLPCYLPRIYMPSRHGLTFCKNYRRLRTRQAAGLNDAIVAAGRDYFGTALTLGNNEQETEIVNNLSEFGAITPENAMKWDALQPSQGQFSFDGADAYADYVKESGHKLRCHTLVWHSQLPSWVSGGGFDNATLIQVMDDHIKTVVERYKGVCHHWDVVNEGGLYYISLACICTVW